MKIESLLALLLSIFLIANCSTLSSSTTADFKVKIVDEVACSPISGVIVKLRTTHFTGRKSSEVEESIVGITDAEGVLRIGKLNNYSRDHSISFVKPGYGKMHLVVRELDGQHIGLIVLSNNDHIGEVSLTEARIIKIPMRRK